MKRILLLAPVLALCACTTDDLESFADGLNTFAYELDSQVNAPCPGGMYREHVADALATSYPQYQYQQIGYQLSPLGGGYSYCAFPTAYYGSYDDDYRDGYRDGCRDGERDERRD